MTTSRGGGGGPVRSIQALYDAGTLSGLDDAELLARFLDGGDGSEAAFEALVARHGAMVLRVCRSVAGRDADAEDAFQATFLVLACRAASVRRRGALGPWLFGVARRIANRARLDAARRRSHERHAAEGSPTAYDPPGPDDDLAILMDELARLPARDREPLILCHLQGLTYQAAADRLRCPLGTLSVRLHRAKQRLRTRLERRGVTDPSRRLAPLPPPLVPVTLSTATARLATLAASALRTGVPISVLTLTQGVLRTMRIRKLIEASAALLALAAGAWTWRAAASDERPPAALPGGAESRSAGKYQLTGRIVDRVTKAPVTGATMQARTWDPAEGRRVLRTAQSDANGEYALDLPPGHSVLESVITPAGYSSLRITRGFALSEAAPMLVWNFEVAPGLAWQLSLVYQDGAPIEGGEVWVDLQQSEMKQSRVPADGSGRVAMTLPLAGGEARIVPNTGRFGGRATAFEIRWEDGFRPDAVSRLARIDADLDRHWLIDEAGRSAMLEYAKGSGVEPDLVGGRVVVRIVLPRPPLAEVEGSVVDESGRPVAGARVDVAATLGDSGGPINLLEEDQVRTTTDAFGRYRLSNVPCLPAGAGISKVVIAVTKDGFAGVDSEAISLEEGGHGTIPPVTLRPASSLVGVVVDAAGKPVVGAEVEPEAAPHSARLRRTRTGPDGRFAIAGLAEGSIRLGILYGRYGRAVISGEPVFTARRDAEPVTVRLLPLDEDQADR